MSTANTSEGQPEGQPDAEGQSDAVLTQIRQQRRDAAEKRDQKRLKIVVPIVGRTSSESVGATRLTAATATTASKATTTTSDAASSSLHAQHLDQFGPHPTPAHDSIVCKGEVERVTGFSDPFTDSFDAGDEVSGKGGKDARDGGDANESDAKDTTKSIISPSVSNNVSIPLHLMSLPELMTTVERTALDEVRKFLTQTVKPTGLINDLFLLAHIDSVGQQLDLLERQLGILEAEGGKGTGKEGEGNGSANSSTVAGGPKERVESNAAHSTSTGEKNASATQTTGEPPHATSETKNTPSELDTKRTLNTKKTLTPIIHQLLCAPLFLESQILALLSRTRSFYLKRERDIQNLRGGGAVTTPEELERIKSLYDQTRNALHEVKKVDRGSGGDSGGGGEGGGADVKGDGFGGASTDGAWGGDEGKAVYYQ
jgi:hypothetical protein